MVTHFKTTNRALHLSHLSRYDVNMNLLGKRKKKNYFLTPRQQQKTSSIIFKMKPDIIFSLSGCHILSFVQTHPPVLHHNLSKIEILWYS